MRRRVRHASRATRPSQPREQISTLDGFARSEETRGGDTPKRPADPLDPRTSRLVSNRADTVLGSRLTDDAIWPTPSTPAKVRRDPLSAATFSAPPAASAPKTTTTRAVRAVAHFLFCDDFRRAFVFSRRRSNPTPSDRTRVHVSFRLNHADPLKQDAPPTAGASTSAASSPPQCSAGSTSTNPPISRCCHSSSRSNTTCRSPAPMAMNYRRCLNF